MQNAHFYSPVFLPVGALTYVKISDWEGHMNIQGEIALLSNLVRVFQGNNKPKAFKFIFFFHTSVVKWVNWLRLNTAFNFMEILVSDQDIS